MEVEKLLHEQESLCLEDKSTASFRKLMDAHGGANRTRYKRDKSLLLSTIESQSFPHPLTLWI
jgi:hypothetical protein